MQEGDGEEGVHLVYHYADEMIHFWKCSSCIILDKGQGDRQADTLGEFSVL